MSNVIINNSNLTNIANAIRNKNGSTNTYKPSEMANAINNISISEDLSEELTSQNELLTTQETTIDEIFTSLQNKIASGSNMKFKIGTFTIDADATEYTLTGLGFTPKLLIVDSGNMGVADVARSVHWQYDEFTRKNFVCSHKSTNNTVTIAVSNSYCTVNNDGFYIKQYLTLPLLAGTYTYIALSDE